MFAIAFYSFLLCAFIYVGLGFAVFAAGLFFCVAAPLPLLVFGTAVLEPLLYISMVVGFGFHALFLYREHRDIASAFPLPSPPRPKKPQRLRPYITLPPSH